MSVPNIGVILETPIVGYEWNSIGSLVSLDSAPEITEAIEAPAEVNRFVAPDVSLRVYDDPNAPWVISLFEQITPTATDWLLSISCDTWSRFQGYILPNTVQIDDIEGWVSFTAVGNAQRLSTVSAELDTLKRTVSTGWRVVETSGGESFGVITIDNTAGSLATCEIESGDTVSLALPDGQEDLVSVVAVEPVGTASPYAQWDLTVKGMKQQYEVGTVVTLTTPYLRHVPIKTVVDALFVGAGLPATVTGTTYLVAGITGAGAPFSSPLGQDGLAGNRLGVSRNASAFPSIRGYWPMVGTSSDLYEQPVPPQGPWQLAPGAPTGKPLRPVDWFPNGNGAYLLYGDRYRKRYTRSGGVGTRPDGAEFYFYAYDYTPTSPPARAYRYVLKITVDNLYSEVPNVYNWDSQIYRESSTDYATWAAYDGPWGVASGATTTNLHEEIPLTCGIAILGLGATADRVYWTEPVSAAGSITYRLSELNTSGFAVTSGVVTGIRGAVIATSSLDLVVFQRDELRGNLPTAYGYTYSIGIGLVPGTSTPIPSDIQPYTLRLNAGDGYYYALSASPTRGVYLLSGVDGTLGARPGGWTPPQLYPPAYSLGVVDMAIVRGNWIGTGPYPIVALFGNSLWWVAFDYSGILPYADMAGLSCGDALAQLATLQDAFFWVDRLGVSWFKSRSVASTKTIGTGRVITSTRIDDDGCLSLRRAGVWYKAVRHITIKNETDETIVGEAGDPAFIGNELALELTNRFVYPQSFATALAEHLYSYLGRALTAVDAEHVDDARDYSIGNTFTASINGVLTTFQIIDSTHRPAGATVRVQGIEL